MHILEAALLSNLATPAGRNAEYVGAGDGRPTHRTRCMLERLFALFRLKSGVVR